MDDQAYVGAKIVVSDAHKREYEKAVHEPGSALAVDGTERIAMYWSYFIALIDIFFMFLKYSVSLFGPFLAHLEKNPSGTVYTHMGQIMWARGAAFAAAQLHFAYRAVARSRADARAKGAAPSSATAFTAARWLVVPSLNMLFVYVMYKLLFQPFLKWCVERLQNAHARAHGRRAGYAFGAARCVTWSPGTPPPLVALCCGSNRFGWDDYCMRPNSPMERCLWQFTRSTECVDGVTGCDRRAPRLLDSRGPLSGRLLLCCGRAVRRNPQPRERGWHELLGVFVRGVLLVHARLGKRQRAHWMLGKA